MQIENPEEAQQVEQGLNEVQENKTCPAALQCPLKPANGYITFATEWIKKQDKKDVSYRDLMK